MSPVRLITVFPGGNFELQLGLIGNQKVRVQPGGERHGLARQVYKLLVQVKNVAVEFGRLNRSLKSKG